MVGEIIVQEVEVESDVDQLTIDSFTIFSQDDHTKFYVQGDVIGSSTTHNLTYLITDSNGNVVYDYPSYTQPNGDRYGLEGPVFWNVTSYGPDGITPTAGEYTSEYNGNFTLKICASDHGICIEEAFTINSIVEDTAVDVTPPVIIVPNNIVIPAMLSGYQVVPLNVTATDNVEITGNINDQPYPYCTIPALTGSGTTGLSMTPSNMEIGMDFQIGTTTVTCNVSDTSGNSSAASFTVTVIDSFTPQLTITSLELYESGSQTRFHVIGDAPEATNLTFGIYGPNGSGATEIGSTSTGAPSYDHDGLVSNTIDILSGGWNTFAVCAQSYEMCVEESFTIDAIGYGTVSTNSTQNIPFIDTSSISGKIWEDYNGNGVYDASGITNHPGNCSLSSEDIGDVRIVRLTDSNGQTQEYLTHVHGEGYSFTNLIAGELYTVTYVNPWPHLNQIEISPFEVNVTLSQGESKIVNFGMSPASYGTCIVDEEFDSEITLDYLNESDNRFLANESFTIHGNWNKPGQSNQPNTNQCYVWVFFECL